MTPVVLMLMVMLSNPDTGSSQAAEVRSLLAARCYACHGPDAESRKAGLRLDTSEGQRSESGSSVVVIPGDPDSSLLLQRVMASDPVHRMPPSGPPLEPEELQLIQDWISEGAPWPEHWAWQPIDNPQVPEVADEDWIRDPIDAFILSNLESADVEPASQAIPEVWLRRVHFDLLGLPPEPERILRFREAVQIDPDQAKRDLVDDLLESPHFGEHWGRHWLDLVRYAETCGHEFDYPIPHAWRYRDWVIRAFNEDVSYDRFVIEHVAGDLVADPRVDDETGLNESIQGTGFWYLSQGTHAPVDVVQDEADRIENQIDVFGKTFSAVTLSCARCHDHKFDPISTNEYYALSGYLQSSRRRDAYLDPNGAIESRLQELQQRKRRLARDLIPFNEPVDRSDTPRSRVGIQQTFDGPMSDWFQDGQAFSRQLEAGEPYIQDDSLQIAGSGQWHSGLRSSRAQGAVRSPSFVIEHDWLHHRVKGRASRIRLIIDGFRLNEYNALLFEDCLKSIDEDDWHHVAQNVSRYRGHVAWIEYSDDGDGWIAIDEIQSNDNGDEPVWLGAPDPEIPDVDRSRLDEALRSLTAEENTLDQPVRILSITDGTPEDQHVFLRGDPEQRGPIAPRSWPMIMKAPADPPVHGSGRLQLAESLVSPDNPLTARVMVNRIWHHLFGQGIVETVDDFGAMGRPPSHPELLDHLSHRFGQTWSIKQLIKDIVLSGTYGMSSSPESESVRIDPENKLLHHHPVKRLTAESIRDAILCASGQFNPSVGGPSVATHLTEHMTGRGRPGASGPLDGDGRRSIYLEVRRNFLSPMLTAFDLPVPATTTGRRSRSNVPAQSLVLMNDPFVHEQSRLWGLRILNDHPDDETRIRKMFLESLGRSPSENELGNALDFIRIGTEQDSVEIAWMDLGHSLINSKEFIYLD
ncbi:MAG: hypothetical protein CMJ29_06375 [Phycisphaerae bacterium]|nr:hypothetical protein [Phycisphaerae bacterium]|tara:strand:+ start:83 stop:2842 length:2760 start_codon:yes stop_codon:yes gene_type:complete